MRLFPAPEILSLPLVSFIYLWQVQMHSIIRRSLYGAAIGGLMAVSVFAGPAAQPLIEHSPITVGVRGQNIVLRAHVTHTSQTVKQVLLFYAVSRDAAPYKMVMNDSGSGWFTGTLPPDLTAGLKQLLYYIEARDATDATAETPWYVIELKGAPKAETVPAQPPVAPVAPPGQPEGEKSTWRKPALVAGGVLLAGGAALALSGGGGGGGGGSSSDGATTNSVGTYSGSATACFQPPGGSSSCTTHAISIAIQANGTVSSDSLREGTHLEGKLSGANFLLVAPVKEGGLTGEIQYLGTVVNNRIAGSIQGTATSADGTGTYSGNFSAMK